MAQKVVNYLRSSSSEINKLLGSIFVPGTLMLIYALYKRGKTNICLDYALNAVKAGKKVLYIDGDLGGVNTTRLSQLLKNQLRINVSLDPRKVLTAKGLTFNEVENLSVMEKFVMNLEKGYDLIIIDSLTLYFRTQITSVKGYGGNYSAQVMSIVDALRFYCRENNAAAIITAQRVSEIKAVQIAENARSNGISGMSNMDQAKWRAFVGGEALGYYVDLMVELESYENGKRKLKLIDARAAPAGECEFKIADGGIS